VNGSSKQVRDESVANAQYLQRELGFTKLHQLEPLGDIEWFLSMIHK
jgi:hypothetical protein